MSWTGADTPEIAAKILASMGNPTTSIVDGGEIVAIKTEHVWVEAFCDVGEYRGLGDETNAKMWIPLDPSFKRCNKIQGSINEDKEECYPESYYDISLLEEEDELGKIYKYNKFDEPMDELKDKLTEYLNNKSSEGKRVIDVIGGLEIIQEDIQVLPFSLPNKVVSINNKSSEISNDKKEKISISLIDEYGLKGELYLNATELYGKKLTLSWLPNSEEDEKIIEKYGNILNTPAYLIEVKPVIKADGEIQNFSIKLGRIGLSSSTINATLIAGGYYALGLDYGSITENELNKCISNVNAVKDKVNTSNYYTDEVAGELVNGVVKTYFAKLDGINKITSEMYDVEDVRSLSFGISGLKPRVQYTFNTPVDVSLESMYVDIGGDAHTIVSRSGDEYSEKMYMINTGTIASSMESMVIEEVTGLPAVSTISIMEQAKNEGQKIYDINKDNINEILPLLNIDSYIKDEITNAVNGENTITIPESEVNYYDWTGSVYIVSDPNTGASGYMISGGLAGGESSTEVDLGEAFEYFLIGLVEGAGSAIPFIAISLLAPFAPTIITLIVDVIALILFGYFIKSTAEELFELYYMYEEGLISKQQACNALAEIIGMVAGGMAVGWAAGKFVKSPTYEKMVNDNIRSYCKEYEIDEYLGEKIYKKSRKYEFKEAVKSASKAKKAGIEESELFSAIEQLSSKAFRKYCDALCRGVEDSNTEVDSVFKDSLLKIAQIDNETNDNLFDKVTTISNKISYVKNQIKDGKKEIINNAKIKVYDFVEKIGFTFEDAEIVYADGNMTFVKKSDISNWEEYRTYIDKNGRLINVESIFGKELAQKVQSGEAKIVQSGTVVHVKEGTKTVKSSVVPNGYSSSEQYIKLIELGEVELPSKYENLQEFKNIVKAIDAYLNDGTGKQKSLINSKYANETIKVMDSNENMVEVDFDNLGIIEFRQENVKVEVNINNDIKVQNKGIENMSRLEHFKAATRELKNIMQSKADSLGISLETQLKNEGFNENQISNIINEKEKIEGYTWHHDEKIGKLQLVDKKLHRNASHNGGFSLWPYLKEIINSGV